MRNRENIRTVLLQTVQKNVWLSLGIVLTVAGFVCLMDPWVSVAAMGMTVGIVFLLEGVSSIVYACISRTKDI